MALRFFGFGAPVISPLPIYKPGKMPIPATAASVAILGCARDVAGYLPRMKSVITDIRSIFRKSHVCIYENDSRDSTLQSLRDWETSGFARLITERNVPGNRTERLARGRNLVMEWAMSREGERPTYVIVMDLDDVNEKLQSSDVSSCFAISGNWGAIGANQTLMYYDLWALRTFDDWMPYDCWKWERERGEKGYAYCVGSRLHTLPANADLIEVISCFGGFALYKTEIILGGIVTPRYFGVGCEHVSFNRGIRHNGGAILIAPFLLNST